MRGRSAHLRMNSARTSRLPALERANEVFSVTEPHLFNSLVSRAGIRAFSDKVELRGYGGDVGSPIEERGIGQSERNSDQLRVSSRHVIRHAADHKTTMPHQSRWSHTLEKQGTGWKASGTLKPMTTKGGPHYAEM